jgi:hypothetical protein
MQDSQKLKERMKEHVDVLLQDFFEDLDLLRILPGVGLQVGISFFFCIDLAIFAFMTPGSGMEYNPG